jgi:hypothetical protein
VAESAEYTNSKCEVDRAPDHGSVGENINIAAAEASACKCDEGVLKCEATDGRGAEEGEAAVATEPFSSTSFSSASSAVPHLIPLLAAREPVWVWLWPLMALVVVYTGAPLYALLIR